MTKNPSWIQFSDEVCGEAIGPTEYDSFLDSLDGPTLPAELLEPQPGHNTPLLPTWIAEYELSRLVGPHEQTWKYRWGIEKVISRMSSACHESVGTERESNLRQLRDAEAARREFCQTPEFRAAVAYALAVVDRAVEAAGNDLTPAQVAAKGRYDAIRATLEAMTAHSVDAPENRKEPHSEENSSAAERTIMKRAAILERLVRRYPKIENDFKRGEPWLKDCAVPDKHGYYFFELIERGCVAKWGGSSGGDLSPRDYFSPQAQLARANRS